MAAYACYTSAFAPAALKSAASIQSTGSHSLLRISPTLAKKDEVNSLPDRGKLSLGGFFQLLTMGAGAPSLGEYKYTEKDTGKMIFEIEANNAYDKEGNEMYGKNKYFKNVSHRVCGGDGVTCR